MATWIWMLNCDIAVVCEGGAYPVFILSLGLMVYFVNKLHWVEFHNGVCRRCTSWGIRFYDIVFETFYAAFGLEHVVGRRRHVYFFLPFMVYNLPGAQCVAWVVVLLLPVQPWMSRWCLPYPGGVRNARSCRFDWYFILQRRIVNSSLVSRTLLWKRTLSSQKTVESEVGRKHLHLGYFD